jgi:two-component system sensor histidine kinase RegB
VDPPLGEGVTLPHKTQMSDLSRQDVNRVDRLGFDDAIFTLAPEGLGSAQSALGRTRLRTFITLRWLAVAGQTAAVLFVAFVLHFDLPLAACLAIIAASAWLNVFLSFAFQSQRPDARLGSLVATGLRYGAARRPCGGDGRPVEPLPPPAGRACNGGSAQPVPHAGRTDRPSGADTGGDHAPDLAAPALDQWRNGGAAAACFTSASLLRLPSAWCSSRSPAGRVSQDEAKLVRALDAASIVMAREQKLSAIGAMSAMTTHELGTPLATIHLVAKELLTETPQDDPKYEDLTLLAEQADRCRNILATIREAREATDIVHARVTLDALVAEAAAPFKGLGVAVEVVVRPSEDEADSRPPIPEPEPRNPPRHQRLRGERRELRRFPGDRAGQLDR